jgi:hypothetical protein
MKKKVCGYGNRQCQFPTAILILKFFCHGQTRIYTDFLQKNRFFFIPFIRARPCSSVAKNRIAEFPTLFLQTSGFCVTICHSW